MINSYPANNFVQKMLSAYYACCLSLNALPTSFTIEANTMNPNNIRDIHVFNIYWML